jgi:MFS family permease
MTTPTDLAPPARPAAGTPHSAASPGRGQRRRPGRGFWVVGYVFAVTMAFSTVPAPLYVLYQARDHFGALLVTVIFAAYAVGVLASLFLAGHISDWFGRRRMVAAAVGVNMASGVVFLAWPAVPGLITGRVISGAGIGMLTATATAYLSELHAAARPGQPGRRAEVAATAANLGGLGLGALLAGLLAQYAGHGLQLPYLVSEALMAGGALALAATPETVARPRPRPRYHPQRVSVPAADRPAFFTAGLATVAAFAPLGLFTSLAPGFIAGTLGDRSHALAGLATFVVFGAAALAQVALSRAASSRQLHAGLTGLILGLALVTVAVWLPSLTIFLLGGALAGAGAGAAFKGSISTVIAIAPPIRRGETLAGLFLAAYIGIAVPVLGLGLAAQLVSAQIAVLGFAAVLAAVAAIASRRLAADPGHGGPPTGPAESPPSGGKPWRSPQREMAADAHGALPETSSPVFDQEPAVSMLTMARAHGQRHQLPRGRVAEPEVARC